jgi:hypothetical protein
MGEYSWCSRSLSMNLKPFTSHMKLCRIWFRDHAEPIPDRAVHVCPCFLPKYRILFEWLAATRFKNSYIGDADIHKHAFHAQQILLLSPCPLTRVVSDISAQLQVYYCSMMVFWNSCYGRILLHLLRCKFQICVVWRKSNVPSWQLSGHLPHLNLPRGWSWSAARCYSHE